MALSSDLISQFVKITKDPAPTNGETTAYGTMVVQGNERYVQLDGSELYTPASSTVDAADGDRVTVLIKNHTATVTGNLTSPAARVVSIEHINMRVTEVEEVLADTIRTEQFEAVTARIDTLEANNVTISGQLEANTADIQTLKAADVTITGRLSAVEADIQTLAAGQLDVEKLKATFATIEQLNATNADVDTLEAGVGEINTLIFGSATGDTIQTSFANAVIAQLGDAQIKSAMIESVSASKITAGDIVTNNVRVLSEDGRLLISDETIQISDSARVRVQIGKDASNDYSINIWDADGKLMFSEGGLTDDGIKEAIIRNDMVSDTANIAAHKLDIDSLFEEINGSTNTIKSTKVYLDDEKQTLDVAFKALSTTVTDQGTTITSQGTDISTIQGQISSKIWQQDIDTATNTMSTQYSTLSQDLSGFKTTVGETYVTNATFDDLEIGGRNLLADSEIDQPTLRNGGTFTYANTAKGVTAFFTGVYLEPGDYVYSLRMKRTQGIDTARIRFFKNGVSVGYFSNNRTDGEWGTVVIPFTVTSSEDGYGSQVYNHNFGDEFDPEVSIQHLKIERGNKATDWTPAPEDMATAARMTAVEQTASDLTVRMTTAETNVANAAKTATDYLNLSTAGLCVGQNPANPTAGNTLITTDGVSIRKGTTVLGAFKAASRTASGITSATITSSDISDSESDGTTSVSGTVNRNETRANIYISTNGNPVYFPTGIETDKVLVNDDGIISNGNIVLDGSIVDDSGEGIFTPRNSYGNTIIGYGRYQDGGSTHVYGTRVKVKSKSGFSASVNGSAAIETNNSSGNATFGWHLYEAGAGETNIYGQITSLVSKGDMRLNANGNYIRFDGSIVPYSANTYSLGAPSLAMRNIFLSNVGDGETHGLRFANASGSATYLAVGIDANGNVLYGNSGTCTNITGKSTTTSSTGYSFKITCGANPGLTVDDNDARLLLYGGTDSTSRYLGSMAVYKRTYSSNSANVYVTTNGMIGRAGSSSRRYKKDISDLSLETVKGLYDIPVRQFKYHTDYIMEEDERYEVDMPGFIAEEVEEYFPIACDHIQDENGDMVPEMWNSKIIIPSLLKLIQDLNGRVKTLEKGG